MYKLFIIFLPIIIFLGCSNKINPAEFHPIIAQKAKIQPSIREIKHKPNIIIFTKHKNYYEIKAKEYLENLLTNSKFVTILNRNTTIKDEIKLAENAKATNSDLNQADFIIIEDITPKMYDIKYIPPKYYKDKKGRIHKIKGYYVYKACSSGFINIYNVLPYKLLSSIKAYGCYTTFSYKRENLKNYVILKSIESAIDNIKCSLLKLFSPKGYVFELRKKDDVLILHTTLGSENGAKEGDKVDIYEKVVIKIPFSNKEIIEEKKIGEGVISNAINKFDSWVIVKKYTQMPKIGDFVKMNYKFSFWDIFKW